MGYSAEPNPKPIYDLAAQNTRNSGKIALYNILFILLTIFIATPIFLSVAGGILLTLLWLMCLSFFGCIFFFLGCAANLGFVFLGISAALFGITLLLASILFVYAMGKLCYPYFQSWSDFISGRKAAF